MKDDDETRHFSQCWEPNHLPRRPRLSQLPSSQVFVFVRRARQRSGIGPNTVCEDQRFSHIDGLSVLDLTPRTYH